MRLLTSFTVMAGILFLFLCPSTACAQDRINKTDGSVVKCRVVEVGDKAIIYKEWEKLGMPEKYLSRREVESIVFEDGRVQKINASEKVEKSEWGNGIGLPSENALQFGNGFFLSVKNGDKDVTNQLDPFLGEEQARKIRNYLPFSSVLRVTTIVTEAVGGAGLIMGLVEKKPETKKVGLIVGGAALGFGVICLLTELGLSKSIVVNPVNEYNARNGYASSLSFGTTPNGVGLALNF